MNYASQKTQVKDWLALFRGVGWNKWRWKRTEPGLPNIENKSVWKFSGEDTKLAKKKMEQPVNE